MVKTAITALVPLIMLNLSPPLTPASRREEKSSGAPNIFLPASRTLLPELNTVQYIVYRVSTKPS